MKTYTSPITANDVTDELIQWALDIVDGWFQDTRIDWENVWDRMDGGELADGTYLDLGEDFGSPALKKIKTEVRKALRNG